MTTIRQADLAEPAPRGGLPPSRRRAKPAGTTPPVEAVDEEDFGAELSDEELGDLLVREITIDGMCGVY